MAGTPPNARAFALTIAPALTRRMGALSISADYLAAKRVPAYDARALNRLFRGRFGKVLEDECCSKK